MPRVVFYFGVADRSLAAARWLSERPVSAPGVCVLLPDAHAAEHFDQLLWAHDPQSFTPHCVVSAAIAPQTPIVLSTEATTTLERPCLLNLMATTAPISPSCTELIEIVSLDERDKAQARDRFRSYRQQGFVIESIDTTRAPIS
jgi:DNA polymerase III subunit chi